MSAAPRDPAASPGRRWPRRLAIAAVVVALLLALLRVLLPTAIERGAAWAGPRYLGLPVRIANVDLALLRGRVTVEGFAVGSRADVALPEPQPPAPRAEPEPEAGGEAAPAASEAATGGEAVPEPALQLADPTPAHAAGREVLLRWDRVFVDLDWIPLFSRTLRVRALEIDVPRVRLERMADGRIDPLAHARPTAAPAEPEPEPPEAEPGEPWALAVERLALREPDLRIVDETSGDILVRLALDELGLDAIAMRGAQLELGGVGIRGPVLRVRRDFVFAERSPAPAEPAPPTAPPAEPPPAEPPPAEGAEEPAYRVERIAIESARFVWITDAGRVPVSLALHAEGVSAREGERFPLRLSLGIEDGQLELDGQAGLLPPSFAGKVAWRKLPFPPLLLASSPELARWLRSAHSTADLQVQASVAGDGGEPPGVRLSGSVALDALSVADPKDEEVALGWRELALAIRELRAPFPEEGAPPATTRLDLERVRLVAPDVRYAPPTPALDALLGGGAPAPAGAPAAAEIPAEADPAADASPGTDAPADEDTPAQAESAPPAQAEPTPAQAEPTPAQAAPTPADVPAGSAPAPAGAPVEVDVGVLELVEGRLRYEDRSGEQPLAASIEGLELEAGQVAVRTAGGAPRVTVGSLTVDGQTLAFQDASEAGPRSGAVEALALALAGIEAGGGETPSLAVATLGLDAGSVRFEDHTVDPPYRGRLRDLDARAEGLRFPERVARSLKVTGASADGGRFELVGRLDGETGQATLTLNRLALAPFNPYATSAAGYRLGGAASLKSSFRMRGERYDTKNRITLHELEVSSQDPGDFEQRFGIPLDVALALLRDPGGDIDLTVPVTVDEQGTRTGIGSIVAGALRQALVGALTSPLKLLGSVGSGVGGLLGGGGIQPIASEPGGAEPASDQAQRYEGLVRLLAERPELGLRLRGRTGEADRPLVAQRILAERIEAGEGLPELEDGAGFFARRRIEGALEERAQGGEGELEPEDEALLERYVAAVQVPEERLAALARERAEAVRDAAVADFGVAPERLAIGEPAPSGDPGVVLELATAEAG